MILLVFTIDIEFIRIHASIYSLDLISQKFQDPRLANFVEEELITDGTGNIPAVLEDGTIVCRSRDYMPYGGRTFYSFYT